MPRHYFHARRGPVSILDQEGVELADLREATKKAVQRAQTEAGEALKGLPPNIGMIIVDDGFRTVLDTLWRAC